MVILVCQQLVSANSLVIIYLVTVPSEYYQQFFFYCVATTKPLVHQNFSHRAENFFIS